MLLLSFYEKNVYFKQILVKAKKEINVLARSTTSNQEYYFEPKIEILKY